MKYAVDNYYPQVALEPENLRDRNEGLPRPGKRYEDLTLGDYTYMNKPPVERGRLIPNEPWGVQAIKENLAEDPDWLAKQMIEAMREADKERKELLKTTLIPKLEAKMERAKSGATELVDSQGSTVIKSAEDEKFANMTEEELEKYKQKRNRDSWSKEGGSYQRKQAHQKLVGKDGLTDRERRQLKRYREELLEIDARWSPSGEPNFELTDDEKLVPKLWRGDLSMPDELIDFKCALDTINGVEGRMAYDMFQRMRAGFEAGGYVKNLGRVLLQEKRSASGHPAGSGPGLRISRRRRSISRGRWEGTTTGSSRSTSRGFDDEGADNSFITTDKNLARLRTDFATMPSRSLQVSHHHVKKG